MSLETSLSSPFRSLLMSFDLSLSISFALSLSQACVYEIWPTTEMYKIGRQPLAKNDLHIVYITPCIHRSVVPIRPPQKTGPNICFGESPMPLLSSSERNYENTLVATTTFPAVILYKYRFMSTQKKKKKLGQ